MNNVAADFFSIAARLKELKADPMNATTGVLWWCEDCGVAIDDREVIRTDKRPNIRLHGEATGGCGCQVHPLCELCENTGWIDQRIGGHPLTAYCQCPDCHNPLKRDQP